VSDLDVVPNGVAERLYLVGRKFLHQWEEHHMDTPIDGSRGHDEDRLVFTVAEAGELLGISRAFAYELVARGELPVIRLGRRRLVPKVALLALVEANHDDEPLRSAN
jgi:excisionase family DNA binding protein